VQAINVLSRLKGFPRFGRKHHPHVRPEPSRTVHESQDSSWTVGRVLPSRVPTAEISNASEALEIAGWIGGTAAALAVKASRLIHPVVDEQ
jgi:hypothetical protein